MKQHTAIYCDLCDTCRQPDEIAYCFRCGGFTDTITVEIDNRINPKIYKDPKTIRGWILNKQGMTIEPPITWHTPQNPYRNNRWQP
jgi:hypothetical protein